MSVSDNILIVEDDPAWQDSLKLLLKPQGYEVVLAEEYSEGLKRILEAGAWFAIADLAACIVDLRLAGSAIEENWDGLGLLAVCEIRRIPSIVVSGFLTRDRKNRLRDQFGVIACFDKGDFADQEFLKVLRETLVFHRRVRDNDLLQMKVKELNELELHTRRQGLIDLAIEHYRRAYAVINDKQRERTIVRGQSSAEDEALWEQQLSELDRKFGTVMESLSQVSTVAKLDSLRPEIIKECIKWMRG